MHELYLEFFYRHSIFEMLSWGVLLVGLWITLALLMKDHQRVWWAVNLFLLLAICLFIIDRTLIGRGSKREVQLIPFYSLIAAIKSPERIRSDVANLLLFVPLGLSMPFVLNSKKEKKTKNPVKLTIFVAFLFSLFIEAYQYFFSIGLCETDDIICNTLGTAMGTYALVAVQRIGYMSAKKAIAKVLYLGIAVHMPQNARTFNFGAKQLRTFLTRLIINRCGENVKIDKGTDFADDLIIGDNSSLGLNCKLQSGVTIGKNVVMSQDCLFCTEEQGYGKRNPIFIGNDVWIGARTIILPGVSVGDGAVIGAGSIVTYNVEPYSIVAGNPAKMIRKR